MVTSEFAMSAAPSSSPTSKKKRTKPAWLYGRPKVPVRTSESRAEVTRVKEQTPSSLFDMLEAVLDAGDSVASKITSYVDPLIDPVIVLTAGHGDAKEKVFTLDRTESAEQRWTNAKKSNVPQTFNLEDATFLQRAAAMEEAGRHAENTRPTTTVATTVGTPTGSTDAVFSESGSQVTALKTLELKYEPEFTTEVVPSDSVAKPAAKRILKQPVKTPVSPQFEMKANIIRRQQSLVNNRISPEIVAKQTTLQVPEGSSQEYVDPYYNREVRSNESTRLQSPQESELPSITNPNLSNNGDLTDITTKRQLLPMSKQHIESIESKMAALPLLPSKPGVCVPEPSPSSVIEQNKPDVRYEHQKRRSSMTRDTRKSFLLDNNLLDIPASPFECHPNTIDRDHLYKRSLEVVTKVESDFPLLNCGSSRQEEISNVHKCQRWTSKPIEIIPTDNRIIIPQLAPRAASFSSLTKVSEFVTDAPHLVETDLEEKGSHHHVIEEWKDRKKKTTTKRIESPSTLNDKFQAKQQQEQAALKVLKEVSISVRPVLSTNKSPQKKCRKLLRNDKQQDLEKSDPFIQILTDYIDFLDKEFNDWYRRLPGSSPQSLLVPDKTMLTKLESFIKNSEKPDLQWKHISREHLWLLGYFLKQIRHANKLSESDAFYFNIIQSIFVKRLHLSPLEVSNLKLLIESIEASRQIELERCINDWLPDLDI